MKTTVQGQSLPTNAIASVSSLNNHLLKIYL